MPVLKLTQSFLANNLQCPEGKSRIEYCDDGTGMYVEVRATSQGQGTYYLRYKDRSGKTCHQRLGRTTAISLDEARKKAKALQAEIAAGSDPRGEERARLAAQTFTEFFEDRLLPYLKQRKRSWEKDEGMFRLRLKEEFGHLRLDQITKHHAQSFHSKLKAGGLSGATCDHHVKLLRYALNIAVEWEMLDQNQLARVNLFNEDNKVQNSLGDVELQRLLTVLRTDENRPICQVALFLLSTGARLMEALSAEWKNVDLQNRMWRIPAATAKSKRVKSIPLNDAAIDILNQLETEDKFQHVFINVKTGKPFVNVHKVWERLRKDAGMPNLRLHDLRHAHATLLINAGRSLYEVQHILGHSDPKVTQRYAHLSTKSLQEASNCASVIINGAMRVPV